MNDTEWQDIMAPLPPVDTLTWWTVPGLVVLLIILLFTVSIWQRSPVRQALHNLTCIRKKLDHHSSYDSSLNIELEISRILRQRFKTTNINNIVMQDQVAWTEYCHRLKNGCFNSSENSLKNQQALLGETFYWVKQSAKRSDRGTS